MASSFIEDILGSEVDEKAVSAVVGSLESQLASPSGSTSSTAKTIPLLQRSSQVPSASSSAASNASQSNNSVGATNNSSAPAGVMSAKALYHTNSINSGGVSTPINIAPRPIVTTAVSLAPRTVTLLSPRSGTRGYIPVQSGGIGLPLMMGPVGGQLPLSSRMVSGSISLPRPGTPQNLVSKHTSQVRNVQQSEPSQRIAVTQIKQEPRLGQATIMNNNLHMQHQKNVQVSQNHSNLLVKQTGPVQVNALNHVSSTVLPKTVTASGVITANALGTVQGGMNKTAQAQVMRVKEQVIKLKGFFSKLIDLATDKSPEVGNTVRELIRDVMDKKLTEEAFTTNLEKTLNSPSQPNLVNFLKSTLPFLRLTQQQAATAPIVHQVPKPVQSVAAVSKAQPTSLPSSQVTRQVPAVTPKKPRVNPPNTTQQIIVNQRTISQLTPQQQQLLFAQHPRLQQLFPNTQLGTSKLVLTTQANQQTATTPSVVKLPVPVAAAQTQDKSKARPTSFISAVTSGNDDDINDVACMAGVNLQEEQSKILATNSEILNLQLRSCKDSFFLNNKLLQKQIEETAAKHGVSSIGSNICGLVSHATQERLMNIMEKLSIFSLHRLETMKDDPTYQPLSDVKSQLRVFEQIDEIERRKREAREREVLIRAAKSRSRQEDPEQARLKEKAKQLQLEEEETLRKLAANKTALDAIGPRKKRKLDEAISNSTEDSPGATSNPSVPTTNAIRNQFPRQRTRRVVLKDLLLIMEQEKELCNSKLLYKALMK